MLVGFISLLWTGGFLARAFEETLSSWVKYVVELSAPYNIILIIVIVAGIPIIIGLLSMGLIQIAFKSKVYIFEKGIKELTQKKKN